jgi:hypothetical protein
MTVTSYSEVLKTARQLPLEDQVEMAGELLRNLRFALRSKPPESRGELVHLSSMSLQELRALAEAVMIPDRQQQLKALLTGLFSSKQIRLLNHREEETATFRVGDGVIFEMILETTEHKLNSARLYIGIYDSQERYLFRFGTDFMVAEPLKIAGRNLVHCYWDACRLVPGIYSMILTLKEPEPSNTELDKIVDAVAFEVRPSDIYGTGRFDKEAGLIIPEGRWELSPI